MGTKLQKLLSGVVGAGALALCFFHASEARAWVPIDSAKPVWGTFPVHYKFNQASVPSAISSVALARIEAGFATWSAGGGCNKFTTAYDGTSTSGQNYNDKQNTILWVSGTWPSELGDVNSVIGITMPTWQTGGSTFDADIQFNNVGFCWNDTGTNNCVDTQSIATHEQGHFLGLGHTTVSGATMIAFYDSGTLPRTIELDDITGVCTLYPNGKAIPTSSTSSSGAATTSAGNTAAATTSSSGGSSGSTCDLCTNTVSTGTCKTSYNACGASKDCIAYYDCVSACTTQSCANACTTSHSAGAKAYNTYVDCACTACATNCASECGTDTSSASSTTAAATTSTATGNAAATTAAATTGGGTTAAGGTQGNAGTTATGGDPDTGATGTGGSGATGTDTGSGNSAPTQQGGGYCSMGNAPASAGTAGFFMALAAFGLRRRRRS